jgi:hypothetical protein
MSGTSSPPRIFVSYARSDGKALARTLRGRLTDAGFSLWQDLPDLEGGRDWWYFWRFWPWRLVAASV